jgi:hypothetical protein
MCRSGLIIASLALLADLIVRSRGAADLLPVWTTCPDLWRYGL